MASWLSRSDLRRTRSAYLLYGVSGVQLQGGILGMPPGCQKETPLTRTASGVLSEAVGLPSCRRRGSARVARSTRSASTATATTHEVDGIEFALLIRRQQRANLTLELIANLVH